VRRRAPRPLAAAVEAVAGEIAPRTALARVQGVWSAAVGDVVGAESEPESERDGVITVACSSAVWASELDLLRADLLGRLNDALGAPRDAPAVRELRFRTRSAPGPPTRRPRRRRSAL
jgi:predicted nucleic acid-binding Zn ribbon protein